VPSQLAERCGQGHIGSEPRDRIGGTERGETMAFGLEMGDRTVGEAVRRIAVERIDGAIDAIDDPEVTPEKAVHTVRKRCKELRALVRLVAPAFGDAKAENRAFRDIARSLSGHRDAQVMSASFEALVAGRVETLDAAAVDAVRTALREEAAPAEGDDTGEALREAREALAAARLRALAWSLDAKGWNALGEGLEGTYRDARRGMRKALASEDGHRMHEWRKDAKSHANQLDLVAPVWPRVLKRVVKEAESLGEDLGDHHDLEVLSDWLERHCERLGGHDAVAPLIALCRVRQAELARSARSAGERLFAEKPQAFGRRMRGLWSAWRRERSAAEVPAPPAAAPAETMAG